MITWFQMSESVWLSSVLLKGQSYMIEKRADGYRLKVSSLSGTFVLESRLRSFEMAKEKAEENLYRRMKK